MSRISGFGLVLVELSVVEQRYHAVMEVAAGLSVTEVAARYAVSRQSVYSWLSRYRDAGLSGLVDRSHRPDSSPLRIDAQVEALICELRRSRPVWGPRRLVFELERRGVGPAPSRSTVYRVLVRNGLIEPEVRRRARSDYRRWERSAPMELWQMDIVGGVFLADGREVKVVTGIDDHSRFIVIAKVVARATGRAVCAALIEALERFGVPSEVLTDNGKQFTGRFCTPRGSEVMFERICRENGITTRLTKPRSPTTTGKIERWHQSLRRELLDGHEPFADLAHAQAVIDGWVSEYNRSRPHQSLGMAVPASRFTAAVGGDELGLRVPPSLRQDARELAAVPAAPEVPGVPGAVSTAPVQLDQVQSPAGPGTVAPVEALAPVLWAANPERIEAIEVDRVVPASGNMWIASQQIWFGPAQAGRPVTLWIDANRLHVMIGGHRAKTLPSKLTGRDLRALLAAGKARPAGPSPVKQAGPAQPGAIELERTVNSVGYIGLDNGKHSIGWRFAGQRVTLRLDGTLMHVLDAERNLLATLACPLPPTVFGRLQGAHPAGPPPNAPAPVAATAERIVSAAGTFMVAGQRVTVGKPHARAVVHVAMDETSIQVFHAGTLIATVPRTTEKNIRTRSSGESHRHRKAS